MDVWLAVVILVSAALVAFGFIASTDHEMMKTMFGGARERTSKLMAHTGHLAVDKAEAWGHGLGQHPDHDGIHSQTRDAAAMMLPHPKRKHVLLASIAAASGGALLGALITHTVLGAKPGAGFVVGIGLGRLPKVCADRR